eukprot:snap_masked-scaffold_11-processed-gene-11.10-mRNA-1 protein AED:1.00 eAED:1.00 QI:0/-1/0/0/-1/1/1/0/729
MNNEGSEYDVERPICCSVKTFLISNYIWSFLSLALIALGVAAVLLEEGLFVLFPPVVYIVLIIFGAWNLLTSCCGVAGQKMRTEVLFLLFILFISLGLITQTLGFSYLLLYANDVGTISSLDDAAINAQDLFEEEIENFARSDAAAWVRTQNDLKCCGIDFEAALENEEDVAILETGDECLADAVALVLLRQNVNDGVVSLEEVEEDETFGAATGYFCKDKISLIFVDNTIFIGIGLGIYLLLQIVALIAGARMYWVPDYIGGWQLDESDLQEVAERKGIKYAPTLALGNNPSGAPRGPTQSNGMNFLGNARVVSNRLSFRLKNAMAADPNVDRQQPLFKRLSLNNRATAGNFGPRPIPKNQISVGFGEPDPRHAPGGGNMGRPGVNGPPSGPPGMFKRLSNRILTPFGKGLISFPTANNPGPAADGRFSNLRDLPEGSSGRATQQSGARSQYNTYGARDERVGSDMSKASAFSTSFKPPPQRPSQPDYRGQSRPSAPRTVGYNQPTTSAPPAGYSSRGGGFGAPPPQGSSVMGSGFSVRSDANSSPGGRFGSRPQMNSQPGSGFGAPPPGRGGPPQGFGGPPPGSNRNMNLRGGYPSSNSLNSFSGNSKSSYGYQNQPMYRSGSGYNSYGSGPPPMMQQQQSGQNVSRKKKSKKSKKSYSKAGKSKGGKSGGGFFSKKGAGASRGGGKRKRSQLPPGGGPLTGGLMAQIQQGKRLNHTITNDRSVPKV